MITRAQAFQAKENLLKRLSREQTDYVMGSGVSKVEDFDKTASLEESGNYCVVIRLKKLVRGTIRFPSAYMGVRVFLSVKDQIRSQE